MHFGVGAFHRPLNSFWLVVWVNVFNIRPLNVIGQDLDAIDSVWALTAEWEQSWIEWKEHRFQELDTIELDSQVRWLSPGTKFKCHTVVEC